MLSRFIPVFAGVAMAATAGSAFAFDAMVSAPTALRTHASHRAAVIEVIPANAVIDMARCARGWCEASYAGQVGYVHTPVLVSSGPGMSGAGGPTELLNAPVGAVLSPVGTVIEPVSAAGGALAEVVTAPVGVILGAVAPAPAPVVAAY